MQTRKEETSRAAEPRPDAPRVELTVSGVRAVAWGPVEEGWPGIVFYAPEDGGQVLNATWTYRGSKAIGDGLATRRAEPHGPPVSGSYDVVYRLGKDVVGRYHLEITNQATTRYRLRWLQPSTTGPLELQLEGYGEWLERQRLLVAAWAKPGMELHLACELPPGPP